MMLATGGRMPLVGCFIFNGMEDFNEDGEAGADNDPDGLGGNRLDPAGRMALAPASTSARQGCCGVGADVACIRVDRLVAPYLVAES